MKIDPAATMMRSDAELVADSLGGNRDAFRRIVERYQTLICSIAYNATGSVSRSEDVAQETFIAAWQQLPSLRDPGKLRSWLCGIVRHRAYRNLRDELREPVSHAAALAETCDAPAPDIMPSEQAVSREEEAILWRSLEKISDLYREPLILFYREHRSVGQVAAALELSEDTVKQRLSRGRKLLQDEVQVFVENTLRRTAPGRAFSTEVLMVLPTAAGPVASAGLAAGAKGLVAGKSGGLTLLLMPLAPFLGIAAGIAAHWLVIRDTTADRRLRLKKIAAVVAGWVVYLALAVGGDAALYALGRHYQWTDRTWFTAVAGFWWLFIVLTLTVQILVLQRLHAHRRQREAAGEISPQTVKPLPPLRLAAVVAGGHLAMFVWLIALAWRFGDAMGAALTMGIMLGLSGWAFVRFRVPAAVSTVGRHVTLTCAVILLIINLRVDIWLALHHGVTMNEVQHLLPTELVPLLTLALVLWVGLVVTVSKPRHTGN